MDVLPGILAATAFLSASNLAPSAPTAGLPETIERFDHLGVGDAVVVSDLRLEAGHVQCALRSGRAAPVRAGDEVVGLFFEGDGTVEYLAVDPIEAPLVMFNAKKGSRLSAEKTEKGVRLRDSFRRLLWIARGQAVPVLSGGAAAPLAGAFAREREKFRRMHAAPLSHDFALQALNAPSSPLVWAEMDGGKEDLVYELDGVDHPSEGLLLLHSSESRDPELRKFLWPVAMSFQPLGHDRREPSPPRFLLTAVDLELVASAGDDVRLEATETFVPAGVPLRALRLDLNDVWYAASGANLAVRTERVRSATDASGRPLSFDHRNDELVVELAEEAPPDRPVKIRFEIEGDFLIRPGGDNYWALGLAPWFPQPYLAEQAYTLHAVVRVPRPFVSFAPGTTVRRVEEDGHNVLETRADHPIQYAPVLAGKYEVKEEVRDGVTIRVATYALNNPRAMKQLTNVAAEVIGFYSKFLGAFPWDEFNIVEINDYGFGQAPAGTMFITREAFDPLIGEMNQLSAWGVARTFAHEIAHQYWGVSVRIPDYEEQWLSESFAEYCAALFLKARRSEAVYRTLVGRWKRHANLAADAAPIPFASRVYVSNDARRRSEIRTGLLYGKGPLLLAALQREMGDESFLALLRAYQKAFAWKFGSTKTVAGLLQELTKKDYTSFFDRYYWGMATPGD